MCKRVLNKRTNLGSIYLVKAYIKITKKRKLKITWLTKKNGTNWGITWLALLTITVFY